MSRRVLLFILGSVVFHRLPFLPGWPLALIGLLTIVLLVLLLRRSRTALALPAGFVWAHLFALGTQPPAIPLDLPDTLQMTGQVVSLVRVSPLSSRFILRADTLRNGTREVHGDWSIRLSWREAAPLRPGDRLSLSARIKPVHGYASPGAWDYAGWLYWQSVRYTGYVKQAQPVSVATCCSIIRLRAQIGARIDALAVSDFSRGVIRALVIGDKSGLSPAVRNLFRDTGTSHLMAISGLHIGLVAALGLFAVAWVWRRIPPLAARIPAQVAGALIALVASAAYALLAGMTLPTQRALIMLGAVAIGLVLRRNSRPSTILALAALAVVVWHPPSVNAAGFWLSFGAVATILATLHLAPRESAWRSAVRVQLAIGVALWPLLSLFDLPTSASAPLANLVLVPVFGVLVVPLSLVGSLLLVAGVPLGEGVLTGLTVGLDAMQRGLEILAGLAGPGAFELRLDPIGATLIIGAVVLIFLPRGVPLRGLALPLLVAAFLPRADTLEPSGFNLHVLDVGQGLSVIVETQHHTLVFDTGPAYSTGFSTAEAVVLPFLATRGRSVIHRLVLSHADNDHAGGADQLAQALRPHRIESGEPLRRPVRGAARCRAGQAWEWDGVHFAYLHPSNDTPNMRGNNASCVLRVFNHRASVLIAGDIEAVIERQLVATLGGRLKSDIVIAPHHGSRTSSTPTFVAATSPGYLVYSTGWGNRYGFPVDEIDARWRDRGAHRLDTATAGTISFRIGAAGELSAPVCHRVHHRRFWWHAGGSARACHAV